MSTTDRSLEQRLADLFADEAPVRAPDRLADAVLARTSPRRPRLRWLTLAKETPMRLDHRPAFGSPPLRTAAILVLTLLLALLAAGTVVAGASLLPRPTTLIPPERGVFTPTGSLTVPRYSRPTATLLRDGRVLVIGGRGQDDAGDFYVADAEIWDPSTGGFGPAGTLAVGRDGHTATLLRDGRVLVVGGLSENGVGPAEIWDPSTSTFSPTASPTLTETYGERASLLSDGRVLVVDGAPGSSAEVYDPEAGTWSPGDSLPEASYPAGLTLADGRILTTDEMRGSPSTVFDPATGTSVHGAPWPGYAAWSTGMIATRLADGRVLVVSGGDCAPMPEGSKTASIETAVGGGPVCSPFANTSAYVWDPATMTFSPTSSLLEARMESVAVLLADGRVLVVGGYGDGGTLVPAAEVFELR